MFEEKVKTLLEVPKGTENKFLNEGLKETAVTLSGNGAKKYSTSGNDFVDDFASVSHYKEPRSYSEISRTMDLLWSQNPELCLRLTVYIRLITRKSVVVNSEGVAEELGVQRGQGLKHEGIMRMMWLAINHPNTFKANIPYFIAAGSWKDIFQMLSIDLQYNGWEHRKLNWKFFMSVISAGLANEETTNLVRKYMPTIRTNKNCKTLEAQADTIIGRWVARKLFPNLGKESAYKCYRKIKTEGQAHKWQQAISNSLYQDINFNTIAGRALAILVGSNFLRNHGLEEKYFEWIKSQPVAKYTGYVHELFSPLGSGYRCSHVENYKEYTINAQFEQLVKTGKEGVNSNSTLLVVRDTSSSMTSTALGCNVSSYDIGKSMALYFSSFLKGPFANSFAEFANTCTLHQWKGNTPVDKYVNDRCEAYGSTNFQSVIDLFIKLKRKGVSESDFPTGLLLISDGELNPAKGWYGGSFNDCTNFQLAIRRLREAGFSDEYVSKFKIISWDIPNRYYGNNNSVKFEDFADAPNFYYLSGYDPSAIAFILGTDSSKPTPRNAEELFEAAMNQELLNMLKVID